MRFPYISDILCQPKARIIALLHVLLWMYVLNWPQGTDDVKKHGSGGSGEIMKSQFQFRSVYDLFWPL